MMILASTPFVIKVLWVMLGIVVIGLLNMFG